MPGTNDTSMKEFYDGLFHSPIFATHQRICCNVGFASHEAVVTDSDVERGNRFKFHVAHPDELCQLRIYEELVVLATEAGCLSQFLVASTASSASEESKKLTILDVGCGAGGGLCELQALFPYAEIVGLDLSSQAIERSQENWKAFVREIPGYEGTLRLVNQPCERMKGIATGSVEVVCLVQLLQDVRNTDRALAEIARVLKPGGVLMIADFLPNAQLDDRFELVQEREISLNVLLSCKQNTPVLEALIRQSVPDEFQGEMKTFFCVENSEFYQALQRGELAYRLLCLKKKNDDVVNGSTASGNDEVEWSDVADDGSYYTSDDEEPIYDDDMPNYYSYDELFPQLEVLKTNYDVILEEMLAVQQSSSWPFWPEKHYTEGESEWRVFPFCYTFPAYDASKTTWVDSTCELCPRTVEVLKKIPGIRTALFSKLGPGTTLAAHRGWADLSNHILRCHIGLVVPTLENGAPCCSMVVSDEKKYHREREIMVFDDSKLHYAFNHHDEKTRIVLIIDLYRPDHLPRGKARGGHSDELDEFIETFGKQMLVNGDDDDDA